LASTPVGLGTGVARQLMERLLEQCRTIDGEYFDEELMALRF